MSTLVTLNSSHKIVPCEFTAGCEGHIVLAEAGTADLTLSCARQGSEPEQVATIQLLVLPRFGILTFNSST